MRVKEVIGCLITVLALVFLLYGLIYVSLTKGYIGVSGTVSYEVLIVALGWILILIGPWLWFGEVPLAMVDTSLITPDHLITSFCIG